MTEPLKILILEDNAVDAEIVQRLLKKENLHFEFGLAMNKEAYLQELDQFKPDLILADYSLPQFNAEEALEIVRQRSLSIPFILVTGTTSEEFAAHIIKLGADDYVLKDRLTRLPVVINVALKKRKLEKEKLETQEKLIQSEANLKQVMDNSAEMIWSMDREHRLITFNKAFSDEYTLFTGAPPVRGLISYKAFGPDGEAYWKQKVDEVLTGISVAFERFYKMGGQTKYSEIFLYPIKNENTITGATCFMMNITERKKAEAEKERLLNVLQKSLNEIYTFNPGTLQFEYVNDGALRNLGYSMEEMSMMTPLDIEPEYTVAKFRQLIAPLVNQEKEKIVFETAHKRADGSLYLVEIHLQLITQGGQSIFLAIVLDITVRKKAELKLRESEQKLREITTSLPGIVFQIVFDDDGKMKYNFLSDGIKKYLDVEMEDIYKNSELVLSKIHPDDIGRLMTAISVSSKNLEPLTISYRVFTKEGKYIWVRSDSLPVVLDDGRIVRNGSIIDITETKEAEEKVKESEAKYRSLMQQAGDSIVLFDGVGQLLDLNESALKLLGYNGEEYKKMSLKDIVLEEDLKENPCQFGLLNKGEPTIRRRRVKRKDGLVVEVELHVKILSDGRYLGVARDLTERIKAEKKLLEKDQQLREISSSIPGFIYRFELTTTGVFRFPFVSESAKALIGVSPEEVYENIGNAFKKVHPDDLAGLYESIYASANTLTPWSYVFRITYGPEKLIKWIRGNSIPKKMENGSIIWNGAMFDITELILAEEKIKESEQKYRSMVERNLAGIYQTTAEGKILTCNAAFAHMLGYTADFLQQQDADILYFSKADRNEFITLLQRTSEISSGELKLKHRDGNPVFVIENCFLQTNPQTGEQLIDGVVVDISKRKLAEEKVRESEERYRTLVEQASDGILLADFQGNILDINSALCSMFGYTREEALQRKITSFLEPYDLKLKPVRFDLLQAGHSILLERKAVHKNGNLFDIELSSKALGEGKMLSIIRDISERKKAEEQIRLSEEKYRSFFDQSADAIFIFDKNGHFLDVNRVSSKLLGYTRKELLSMSVFDIVHKETLAVNPIQLDLLATGESVIRQRNLKKKDGSSAEVEIHSKKLPGGNYLGIVRDITERKKAEEALKESEAKYRTIIDTTYEMIHHLSTGGEILWVNESWKKNMGMTEEEIIGKKLIDFLDEPTKTELGGVLPQLMKGQRMDNLSWGFITKKRETISLEVQTLPLISNGKIIGSQAFLRNVTEWKKAQEEILKFNERFELIAANTHDGIWEWNLETGELWANEMHQRLYGLTINDPVPTHEMWKQRLHPDDRNAVIKGLEKFVNSKENVWMLEYRFKTPGGEYMNIFDRNYIIRNASGKAIRRMGSLMDITERHTAGERIRKQEKKFRDLLESTPDAMVIVNEKGIIVMTNYQAEALFGYTKKELIDSPVEMLMPGAFRAGHTKLRDSYNADLKVRPMGKALDLVARHKDGGEFPAEISLSPLTTEDEGTFITAAIRDITERKKAEEKIRQSNERYEFVNKATQDTIWEWNYLTKEGQWGDGIIKTFGYSENKLKYDENWMDEYIHPDDKEEISRKLRSCIESGLENWQEEYRFRCADGTYKYVYDRGFILFVEQGKPYRMIGAMTDVTEKKRLERELAEQKIKQQKLITETTIQAQEKERNELGRELHDNINQILATVKMYLGLAMAKENISLDLIDQSYEYVNEAMEEIRKLSHSLVAPSLGDIGLKEALEELTEDTNLLNQLQIQLLIDEKYSKMKIDKSKELMFYRIVQEQLNNIIKYAKAKKIVITLKTDTDNLFLSVADNGVGFDTTKRGKGIGLKNISGRVEFYSGKMNITSAPGHGCTLDIFVPINN